MADQIDPAIMADIDIMAKAEFDFWKDNATPEQRAAGVAEMERWTNDPEFAAAEGEKMQKFFTESDVNNDGRLDLAEYRVFISKLQADGASRGQFVDNPPGSDEQGYNIMNRLDPANDGITMAEFGMIMEISVAKSQELKAAAGL